MKSLAIVLGAAALSVLAAVPAAYAGSKTINNNTSDTITVTAKERSGADCSTTSGKAKVKIGPNSSGTLNYSTTYINALEISLTDAASSSKQVETLTCTATGNVGTLDNAFNANSVFEIGSANYGITFSSHN